MKIDENEIFLICGNTLGTIFVFAIDYRDKTNWHLYKVLYDHFSPITSLDIDKKLNIFITCSKDGYCMLYTLPKCNLINSFKLRNIIKNTLNNENMTDISLYSDISIISNSPLPCMIFYFKARNSLCVFSINGYFIKEQMIDFELHPNQIIKFTDHQFIDYLLIYNSKNETLEVYNIIDLQMIMDWEIKNYTFIDFILTKELDNIFLLVKSNISNDEKENQNDENNKYKILLLKINNKTQISEDLGGIKIPFIGQEESINKEIL